MTNPEVRLVLTREAAKILGCSMKHVQTLAVAGMIKNWSLGPTSFAFDIEDLKRYKAEQEAGQEVGDVQDKRPEGISACVSPSNRKKK